MLRDQAEDTMDMKMLEDMHNNANGEICKALRYIYFVWLPNSEYCMDENTLFDFEYYDERWDCQLGAAQMEIYIPVKKMGVVG